MTKSYFAGKEMYIVLAASIFLLATSVVMSNVGATMDVVAILQQIGIANPPSWLVWTIIGAGAVSVVVAALTTFGLATVPTWAAAALVGADSVGL